MNLIFLGPPGAGKGTQAHALAQRLGIPQIATGDILRAAVAEGTPLGREAQGYVNQGELVPDAVMIDIIAQRLQQPDAEAGFILDGFPRTIAQAEALEAVLAGLGRRLDRVIYFDTSKETLVHRLEGRRVCREAGHIYHVVSNPPRVPGMCDVDGSPLEARGDDRPETVSRRLRVHEEQTEPLKAFYQARGLFVSVSAEGSAEGLTRTLLAVVSSEVPR